MNLLVLFAKNPETEKVKTRLAKDIGEISAVEIYKNMLHRRIELHSKADYDFIVYSSGGSGYFTVTAKEQKGNDLGERMFNCFISELSKYDKVIIIGSDIPEITEEIVQLAFEKLDGNDVVIGPCADGGYYLIGMKKVNDIFSDISWGTDSVFMDTLKVINGKELSVSKLRELWDLDTKEDLDYFTFNGVLED